MSGLEEKYSRISKFFVSDRFQECKVNSDLQSRFREEMDFVFSHDKLFDDFISIRESIDTPGRSNKTNSLTAYVIGITDCPIDISKPFDFPSEYVLTRFTPPDVDLDFENREPIFDYLVEKYGEDRTSFIITYSLCRVKKAVQMAFKIKNITIGTMDSDQTSKFISKQIKNEDDFEESINQPELKDYVSRFRDVFDLAKSINNIAVAVSQHAGGILITNEPITEHVPLRKTPRGLIASEYDKEDVENIGLLKYDILGVRTFEQIHMCVDMIREKTGHIINIRDLPLNDDNVFEIYRKRETSGIFQMGNYTMVKTLESLKVNSFEDLAACNAIGRPGPINEGYPEEYGRRQMNPSLVQYYHPVLKECLKESYGLMIYQEQVTKVSQLLAGLSVTQSDKIRKFIGKKQTDEEKVRPIREMFISGCKKHGLVNEEFALKMWKIMEGFGQYAFNKGHSVVYAIDSYWTAWLKTYYYVYFMATLLTESLEKNNNKDKDNIIKYKRELRKKEYTVLPPDINMSKSYYDVLDEKTIIEPFHVTDNIGKNVGVIIEKKQPFNDFEDFLQKTTDNLISAKVMEIMLQNGYFNSFGNKSRFMDQYFIFSEKRKKDMGGRKVYNEIVEDQRVPYPGNKGMEALSIKLKQTDIL